MPQRNGRICIVNNKVFLQAETRVGAMPVEVTFDLSKAAKSAKKGMKMVIKFSKKLTLYQPTLRRHLKHL